MSTPRLILVVLGSVAAGAAAVYFLNGKNQPSAPAAAGPAPAPAAAPADPRIAKLEKELADLKKRQESKPAPDTAEAKPEDKPDANKLLKDAQPLLKSLTAAFEPRRREMAERMIDAQVKRLTALANLTPDQAAALKAHLEQLDKENQDKWKGTIDGDMKMEDLANLRRGGFGDADKALDDWAAANLPPDQADAYKTGRLREKTERITRSANAQVESLGRRLGLDETQKDKLFNIMVQTDSSYDPSMKLEGVAETTAVAEGQSRDEAIAAILTPEQAQKYNSAEEDRRSRRARFMESLGIDPETMRR